jgi:hypothetical protein
MSRLIGPRHPSAVARSNRNRVSQAKIRQPAGISKRKLRLGKPADLGRRGKARSAQNARKHGLNARLDRYECVALSRRKRAIRAFDSARRKAARRRRTNKV